MYSKERRWGDMLHNPYLQGYLSSIIEKMNQEQLYETVMYFIYMSKDEDLEEYFEAELEEFGYNFKDHE